MAVVVVVGCAGSASRVPTTTSTRRVAVWVAGVEFVPAPKGVLRECRSTALAVGYRVPCPTIVPVGITAFPSGPVHGCSIHIIGPAGLGGCAHSWRGWVVGSSVSPHLVLQASPRPIGDYAGVINGPVVVAGMREKFLGWLTRRGWRIRVLFVPPHLNQGSAFSGHVVYVWTSGSHTYAFGFHDVVSQKVTTAWNNELLRGVRLIGR
jgi:hypothetical protein